MDLSPVLKINDPLVWSLIESEDRRQHECLELIASENYTTPSILATLGTILTNKYAEGYPGQRYYGGCQFVDEIERTAITRAKQLFGADHANVQPHSGTQANMAVYFSCLQPGDTVLAMDLAHGGHLTHGMRLNFSGKSYNFVSYGVRKDSERIDFDQVAALAKKHEPTMIVAGGSAYPREIDFAKFAQICADRKALLMVDMAHIAGLIATKHHISPVSSADFVTSTTHKTLRGPRGGFILCKKEWARKIDQAVFPGIQGGPLVPTIAAKAICFREASESSFNEYSRQVIVNAKVLAEEIIGCGFRVVSGGTDNHLILVDATSKSGLTGSVAQKCLEAAGITVNKNMIPFDTRQPVDPSGIRIGTPAVTTRGMKEPEMRIIGRWLGTILSNSQDVHLQDRVRSEIREMSSQFPVPTDGASVAMAIGDGRKESPADFYDDDGTWISPSPT